MAGSRNNMNMQEDQIIKALAGRSSQGLVEEVFDLMFRDGVARKIHGTTDPDITNQLEQKLVALKELVGAADMDTARFREIFINFFLDTIKGQA